MFVPTYLLLWQSAETRGLSLRPSRIAWLGRVQTTVDPVWRIAAAGCHLGRDTASTVRDDDRFAVVELEELPIGVPPVKPFIHGVLVPAARAR